MTDMINKTKRLYCKPELVKFGLLRDLTQSGSAGPNESAKDGMCNPNTTRRPNQNCMG